MSWSVPSGAERQPDDREGRSDTGETTAAFSWKGDYDDLATAAHALVKGDEIDAGWIYSSHDLRRVPGDLGVLTLNCVPDPGTEGGDDEQGEEGEEKPLKDLWGLKSVRNDVSIMAYCGSGENNPKRALIEAWMKEPDGELAKDYQYKAEDGRIVELTQDAATMDLIAKIEKGIESVIRFYPVVTRTRTYANCPPKCLENLGLIDTPPAPGADAKTPNGLAQAIADYQWLKVQDDAQEQPDGNFDRIESWMGILKTDGNNNSPWDADLYGANRWPMPYDHGANQGIGE